MWLITTAWGCLLLGASLLWPMTYGYDETPHIDMAYAYAAHPFKFYAPGKLNISQEALGIYSLVPGHPLKRHLADQPVQPRGQRPTLTELGGHKPSTGPVNQMIQHPPLYYEIVALVTRIPGVSHLPWDVEVWIMRLVSVLLMLPVPLACWAGTRRLLSASLRGTPSGVIERLALAAAVLPLTLPNLIRDGSSVTNDALLISATSVLLYLLCRVVTSDLTSRTAAWVSISLAVALLSKGFALVLPPIVLGAYLVGWLRREPSERGGPMAVLRPLLISAIGGVVGGLWWLRNLVLYGAVQPLGDPVQFHQVGPPALLGHVKRFVPRFTTDLSERIWGGIGYADLPRISSAVNFGFLIVVAIGMLLSLTAVGARGDRWAGLFLLATQTLTFFVAASGSFAHYRHYAVEEVPRASQGRYLYQTIVVVAALATVGWFAVLRPRIRPLVAPVVLAAGAVLNALVWMMILRSWYAPRERASIFGKTIDGVHSLLRFSPLPSLLTLLLVAVLPTVACIAALIAVLRDTRFLRLAVSND
jgi:4-amino-4-deoxy-L-arabinose transferase-like glycosyltransferase